jgi:hypothetical protein
MARVGKPVSPSIADEIAVHKFIKMSFEPDDFTIADARNDVAPEGAVNAEGRTSQIIPSPPFESGGFVGVDSCGTEIDEVPGKRTLKGPVHIPAEVGAISNLQSTEVSVSGKILIKPAAPPTVNAAVHFVPDQWPKILILISSFFPQGAPDPMPSGHGHILEQTLPSLVADRAVVGMVHHKPFDDVPAKIDRFRISR